MQAPQPHHTRQTRASPVDTNNGPANISSHRHSSKDKSNPSQLQISSNMLSQDSIQHYVEDAEKEAAIERKRLAQQESERKQYASQIISQTSGQSQDQQRQHNGNSSANQITQFSFGKAATKNRFGRPTDGSSRKERLHELLEKTEQYTRFILQQNLKHHKAQQKQKFAESILNGEANHVGAQINGKSSSIRNRRQKRTGKQNNNDASSDEENESMLTRLTQQPSILKGGEHTLRYYQLDGLNWMISLYETGINGILADEMGLGKTIQTISLIGFLKEFKLINGYHLIIMPKSVVGNWCLEFKKWLPQCRVLNLIARKEQREEILKTQLQPGKFDVCITTFEGIRLCQSALMKFNWEYIIIDEAHKIKNEDSQTSKRVRQLHSKYRLLLTGTPLQNNLHELWSLMNFLLPEIFASSDDFDDWFDLGSKAHASLSDKEKEEKNNEMIKQLHKILRPFMLRRIKREVEKSLLPKIEMHINVGITEMQKSIYRQLLKKSTIEKGNSTSHYKNILVQLRKVCNHPYLFPGIEPEDAPELGEHLIKSSGKMHVLDKLLKKAQQDKSQSLIFSGFTSMLDILEDFCRFREYKYCRLDGNTELDDRQMQIDDFTSPGTDKVVFLISTRAGGLGLNLMTANTVVLYDSDWNPQMDLQAMDRAHRIGQMKQVRVYRLITKNTMEEKMVEKQTMKLKLDQLIIQKGRMAPKNTGMQKDDLQDMVNYGADAIFEIGSNIDDEDIEELIKNGEDKARNLQEQADEIMKEKFDMVNFEMNSCNLYQFEDVDYLKEKRKDAEDLLKKNVIALMETETNFAGRRKVQKNLAENNLCPNIFGNGNIGVSNEAKKKRLAKVQDFRFFPDNERLKELIELEMESKFSGYIQGANLQAFTPEMKIEKELIESKGFPDWDRRDFQKFIQGLELYATNDYNNISKHMEGIKTPHEVEEYATIFFEKVDTLNDADKIKAKINKAQKNVNFNLRAPGIINKKISQYQNPMEDMNLAFATQKSKFFSKESDILLICITQKMGYGNWSKIKQAVRRETRCRLDHLFVSRSEEELKKRVIYLVQCLEKEEEEAIKKGTQNLQLRKQSREEELEKRYEEMILEAESKANEAMKNLTLTSIIRYANHGLEADDSTMIKTGGNNTKPAKESQDTLKSDSTKQKNNTELKEKESVNDMDKQMMDEQECDYDNQPEENSKEPAAAAKKGGAKKKQASKKKKRENSYGSMSNGSSMARLRINGNNHHQNTDPQLDEDMEEDEILQREMMNHSVSSSRSPQKNIESQGIDGKVESNGNTTTDTINLENKKKTSKNAPKAKPKQPQPNVDMISAKSTKQSNIADWVNSSSATTANAQLVGQKRSVTKMNGAKDNRAAAAASTRKVVNREGISEFNVNGADVKK